MPNLCCYSMCVKGKKKNIQEFIKVIQSNYDYSTMKFDYNRHMFRVFEAYYDKIEQVNENTYQVIISGDCAWSVASCMLDGCRYYYDLKNRFPNEFRGTTLQRESKKLNLDIEVFSEECGCCFQEHYVIIKGDLVADECVDWYEYYLGDFKTKEEAESELDIVITDEEWLESKDDYISRGGFGEWDFEI